MVLISVGRAILGEKPSLLLCCICMLFYNGNVCYHICYTINFGMIKIISDLFYYLGVVEGRSLSSDSSVLVSQTNSGSSTSGSTSESDTRSSSHFSWKLPEERNSYFAAGLCLLSCSKMTKIKYTNYQLELCIRCRFTIMLLKPTY